MWACFTPWGQTLVRWRDESGIADLDVARYFGLERWFEFVPLEYGPWPRFDERELSSDGEYVVSVDYRGITRRNRRDRGSMPEWIDHPVRSTADWNRYKTERLEGPVEPRLTRLAAFFAEARREDSPVQLGAFPWGMFGTLRDLLGTTGCLLAFYDHPDMVHDVIDTFTDLWLRLYAAACAAGRVDHVHIWEDMSGKQGSLISMAMVEEFMMPAYDRIVAFARDHGVPIVSVDTDGLVGELLTVLTRHGVNACMPFEAQAGNDLVRLRREYPGLGMMGGLDKAALARSKGDIHRELDKAFEMLALGGWVPGFDHLIPPDVPWQSFAYAVRELDRMIRG
jgi:uroporphyrinogen decarboxylase